MEWWISAGNYQDGKQINKIQMLEEGKENYKVNAFYVALG